MGTTSELTISSVCRYVSSQARTHAVRTVHSFCEYQWMHARTHAVRTISSAVASTRTHTCTPARATEAVKTSTKFPRSVSALSLSLSLSLSLARSLSLPPTGSLHGKGSLDQKPVSSLKGWGGEGRGQRFRESACMQASEQARVCVCERERRGR